MPVFEQHSIVMRRGSSRPLDLLYSALATAEVDHEEPAGVVEKRCQDSCSGQAKIFEKKTAPLLALYPYEEAPGIPTGDG